MLPLKLVRSLVMGEALTNPFFLPQKNPSHHLNDDHFHEPKEPTSHNPKIPALLFLPTREIITNTCRLASLARDIGLDLHPTHSLSHIIFSYPSSHASSPSSSSTPSSSFPSSFSSSSSSWSFLNDAVPIPFPSLTTASITHLRSFVSLSGGLFKLVFFDSGYDPDGETLGNDRNWDCCSVSLYSRVTGHRIDSMEGFSRALAGKGWTLFKTNYDKSGDRGVSGGNSVYLFRKVDSNRVRVSGTNGGCRVRELRLPTLDFKNAPLKILQYIILMTDDIFCLA